MLPKRTYILLASGFMLFMTTACGQGSEFNQNTTEDTALESLNEDFTDRTDLTEDELIELVGQEQILLMDENQVTLNDDVDDGFNLNNCEDGVCGNFNFHEGATIPTLDGLLDGMFGQNGEDSNNDNGGNCGDRSSHTIQIHGPNGNYVGVGPGNIEVSTQNALVCVAPNEIIVAVGDIEGGLLDAATCQNSEGAEKIVVCQKNGAEGSIESCMTKDQLYVSVRQQAEEEKTYLGNCQ